MRFDDQGSRADAEADVNSVEEQDADANCRPLIGSYPGYEVSTNGRSLDESVGSADSVEWDGVEDLSGKELLAALRTKILLGSEESVIAEILTDTASVATTAKVEALLSPP